MTGSAGKTSTKEALFHALDRMAPGAVLPMHEHTALEQSWVLAGRLVDHEGEAAAESLLRLEMAAEVPTPAEQLDARHRPCNFVPHLKQAAACDSRG